MRRSILRILAAITIMAVLAAAFTLLADASPTAPAHWSAPYNISNSPGEAKRPRIVEDSSQHLHLIWVDDRSGNGDIYHTKSTNGGTSWSTLEPITTTVFPSEEGDIAAGPGSSLHSVWLERQAFQSYSLEYGTGVDGEGWVTSTPVTPAFQLDPAIAVDGTYVYLAWWKRLEVGNPNIYYLRRPITDTVWPEPQLITDTVDGSITPDLAIDSGGNMHVVWHEQVGDGGAIWYSKGAPDDGSVSWSPVINLSQGLANCGTPAIAIGSDDYVHVVWGQSVSASEQYVYYTNFPAGSPGSGSLKKIFTDGLGVSQTAPSYLYPRLAVEGTSTVHVVWHGKRDTDYTDEIWYSISENKGTDWSLPVVISRDPTSQSVSPDIATDDNLVHVVWQGKDANGRFQAMYSRGFPFVVYLPVARKAY